MSNKLKLGVAALAATVALGFSAPASAEDYGSIEVKNCGKVSLDIALLQPSDPLSGTLIPEEIKAGESFKAKLTVPHHPLFCRRLSCQAADVPRCRGGHLWCRSRRSGWQVAHRSGKV